MIMEANKLYSIQGKGLSISLMLIALLLLSSCTVVNAIQSQTGSPIVQKLNPSKAALSALNSCDQLTETEFVDATEKTGAKQLYHFLPLIATLFASLQPISDNRPLLTNSNRLVVGKIPIYILYKKMKLWV